MKILITGVQGFVGSSLGDRAIREGCEVLGIDRKSSPLPDWKGRYASLDVGEDHLVDLLNDFQPDVIVHAAGTASVKNSYEQPTGDFKAAAMTWLNLLENVRRSAISSLVLFPSSAAVYGNPENFPVLEEEHRRPISPYGYHKFCCEILAEEYAKCFGLRIGIARLFSLFGPRQRRLLIWEIAQQALGDQKEIRLQGTGEEMRDYLFIEDCAEALLKLARILRKRPSGGFLETVNLARGESILLSNLTELIRDRLSPQKTILYRGLANTGDPLRWIASNEKLKKLVGKWEPRSLDSSLAECFKIWS